MHWIVHLLQLNNHLMRRPVYLLLSIQGLEL